MLSSALLCSEEVNSFELISSLAERGIGERFPKKIVVFFFFFSAREEEEEEEEREDRGRKQKTCLASVRGRVYRLRVYQGGWRCSISHDN